MMFVLMPAWWCSEGAVETSQYVVQMILAQRGSKDDYVAATSQFSQKLAVDGKTKMKYNGLVVDVSEWSVS